MQTQKTQVITVDVVKGFAHGGWPKVEIFEPAPSEAMLFTCTGNSHEEALAEALNMVNAAARRKHETLSWCPLVQYQA